MLACQRGQVHSTSPRCWRGRWSGLLIGALLATFCLSCTASTSEESESSLTIVESTESRLVATSETGHRVVVDWESLTFELPLDQYLLLQIHPIADIVDLAVDQLVEECMSSRGFDFGFPDREVRDFSSLNLRRYGPLDKAAIEEHGYGRPPKSSEIQALLDFQSKDLDPATELALIGIPGESENILADRPCMFIAGDELTQGELLGDSFGSVQSAAAGSLGRATGSPEVRQALADWRECMHAAGYDVEGQTPLDLVGSFARSEPVPSEVEIETALADLVCKRSTSLIEVWASAEADLQLMSYATNQEMFDDAREDQLLLISEALIVTGIELPVEALRLLETSSD